MRNQSRLRTARLLTGIAAAAACALRQAPHRPGQSCCHPGLRGLGLALPIATPAPEPDSFSPRVEELTAPPPSSIADPSRSAKTFSSPTSPTRPRPQCSSTTPSPTSRPHRRPHQQQQRHRSRPVAPAPRSLPTPATNFFAASTTTPRFPTCSPQPRPRRPPSSTSQHRRQIRHAPHAPLRRQQVRPRRLLRRPAPNSATGIRVTTVCPGAAAHRRREAHADYTGQTKKSSAVASLPASTSSPPQSATPPAKSGASCQTR